MSCSRTYPSHFAIGCPTGASRCPASTNANKDARRIRRFSFAAGGISTSRLPADAFNDALSGRCMSCARLKAGVCTHAPDEGYRFSTNRRMKLSRRCSSSVERHPVGETIARQLTSTRWQICFAPGADILSPLIPWVDLRTRHKINLCDWRLVLPGHTFSKHRLIAENRSAFNSAARAG
jgi:hypothetical protein